MEELLFANVENTFVTLWYRSAVQPVSLADSLAHWHSPYEIRQKKIFLCAGTTKIFFCLISHCSLLAEIIPGEGLICI